MKEEVKELVKAAKEAGALIYYMKEQIKGGLIGGNETLTKLSNAIMAVKEMEDPNSH